MSWWPTLERLVRGDAAFSEKTLVFASGAVAGTNSDFAALCLDALLPSSADVVFLEFDINSAGMGMEGVARSYESLIRKLYRLPHNPAVVLVHVPSDHQKHFQDSIADASNVLLPFYESSAISLRDAYWHHGQEEVWSEDHIHPNDLGNLVIATLAHQLLDIYMIDSASFGAVQPLRSDSMLAADRDDETVCVHKRRFAHPRQLGVGLDRRARQVGAGCAQRGRPDRRGVCAVSAPCFVPGCVPAELRPRNGESEH